jgi:hypothetical protein
MKLSELILAIGDENIAFQVLLDAAQSVVKTKAGTKITFLTDAIQPEELLHGDKPEKMGLVVWLPRDRVEAVVAAEKLKTK